MTVTRLINNFSSWTQIVEVSEVRDQIVEWGFCDGIIVSPFDGPPSALLGMFLHYSVPANVYGSDRDFRVVRYNQNLSYEFQRLVCVKELIHQMDDVSDSISSKKQLSELLDEILHDGSNITKLRRATHLEDIAVYQALAILCPEDVREELFNKFHEASGKITLEHIAERFAIPVEYAGYLMLPQWKGFWKMLAKD